MLDIKYTTNDIDNRLLIEVQKPNDGDEMFNARLYTLVIEKIAQRYTDEYYEVIVDSIDRDKIQRSITDAVIANVLPKVKEKKSDSQSQPTRTG